MAIGLGTLGDYTPSTGNAIQGGSGSAPATQIVAFDRGGSLTARSAFSTALFTSFKPAASSSPAPAPSSANGGCGEEPARKQVGPVSVYADAAAGKAWLDCLDRVHAANLAKAQAAIDAAPDCGPEPAAIGVNQLTGAKIYAGVDDFGGQNVGAYWAACRAKKIPTAQTTSPAIVPGQTTAVPSTLTSAPSSASSSTPQQVAPGVAQSTATVGPAVALALGPTPSSAAVAAAAPAASSSPSPTETAAIVVGGGVVLAGLAWLLLRKR